MFIIASEKKQITASSGTNGSVEFHNQLWDTDDVVVFEVPNPTPEEIEVVRLASEQEVATKKEITEKKAELEKSDYKILKKLEKLLPADDVDVLERQSKRDRINQLEAV
jgi:hypothetical protein